MPRNLWKIVGVVSALSVVVIAVSHSSKHSGQAGDAPPSLQLTCDKGGRTTLEGTGPALASSFRVTFTGGGFNAWTKTTDWLPVRGGAWVATAQGADQADAEVRLLNGPNASVHADCY